MATVSSNYAAGAVAFFSLAWAISLRLENFGLRASINKLENAHGEQYAPCSVTAETPITFEVDASSNTVFLFAVVSFLSMVGLTVRFIHIEYKRIRDDHDKHGQVFSCYVPFHDFTFSSEWNT